MRKLISTLTVTCLLLVMSALQAKATCLQYNNQQIPGLPQGTSVNGEFCYSTTYDFFSYTGTVSYGGKTYSVVGVANVAQGKNKVTVSGSITVSGNGINKQITFNKTVSTTQYGGLSGLITWGEQMAKQLQLP